MIGQILSTMLPVFLIAGCGALYGRYRTPDIQGLNVLNMELFVPMLVFAVLADQQAPLQEYGWLALAATVVVLGSGVILYPVARLLKLNLITSARGQPSLVNRRRTLTPYRRPTLTPLGAR